MKIALVSQEFPPETARGGIGSQTFMKAIGLSKLGHKVYVISRKDTGGTRTKEGEINVIRIPGLEDYIYDYADIKNWEKHSIVVALELNDLNERVGLDLIDFPEWGAEGYEYLLKYAKENRIKTVIQLHGPLVMFAHIMNWPEKDSEFYNVGFKMESTCVQLADAIYSSSNCSSTWVRTYYDPTRKDIPTIHLGIDTNIFYPRQVDKYEQPTIIFVGKLVKNKGLAELIDAAINLKKRIPSLKLRIIGKGEDLFKRKMITKVNNAGFFDLLDFVGFVSSENLPNELSRAHVFAVPSYYEAGPGFVYLEAMACGLPVIGCSGSGVEEIIISGLNGLLVPPRDSKSLEYSLYQLLSNKQVLNKMSNNAIEYVKQNAESNFCVKKLETFYYSVLQENLCNNKVLHHD